ncbi:MAG TPA: penicillin acylase family protein [Actinomycetota bacterium]|nr:penicillin acylase family protein [Actinomycetota bacterium]
MSELTDVLRERARAALPPVEGELRLPGLHEPVEVLWDRWGVPHVYAQSTHDLYFTQGYIHASERLFQIELMLRFGSGRLSEVFGDLTLPIDRFIRAVGWNRAARRLTEQWDDLSWEMSEAFAAGARTWLSHMPAKPVEYEVLQLDPYFPEGREAAELAAAASLLMAWGLSTNWDAELLRMELAEKLGWEGMTQLFPQMAPEAPIVVAGKSGGADRRSAFDLLREAPRFPKGQGSNNWVVAGRRTVTGKPLLANDPHLFVQLPSIWYEIHLSAPGIDVRGVALPFSPGVIIGHNDRIAWGITNLGGDTQDLFLERLSEDGGAALHNGTWEPLTLHREEIAVRGRPDPDLVEARETRHGPLLDSYLIGVGVPTVVEDIRETYALRWVALEEGTKPSTVYRLNIAASFEEFRAALSEWAAPGGNFVYADVDGNIGYQATGWHPIRQKGDGTIPVPGWTGEHEWEGYVPFDELPSAYNPAEGFLATANNKIHDDSYPYLIGKDFLPPFRVRRVVELLTETDTHDVGSFRRIHTDTVSLPAREIVPLLMEMEPADDRQKEALALLADWDFDLRADSAAAALYEVWCCRIGDAILLPRLGEELHKHYFGLRQWTNSFQFQVLPNLLAYPTATWFGGEGKEARDELLRQALDTALDELAAAMGEDVGGWTWGALHRVRFAGQLARSPDLAELFTGGELGWGGDEQTVCQGMYEPGAGYDAVVVPSWRQIIDLSDLDASVGTHTVGQSGNPASPHFNDLFSLWSTGQYHPLPFTREAIEAETESRLELLPE